jgi:outer membrane protein W
MPTRLVLAICLFMSARSVFAQSADVFVRAIDATKEGHTTVHGGAASVFLNEAKGFEAGVDWWWTHRISTELSVASVRHELDASAFGQFVDLGATRETQGSAVILFHSNRDGRFDVHAGAGASYVTFTDVKGTEQLTLVGVRSIHFHNDIAPVADAGISVRLTPRWALSGDVKWTGIESETKAIYLDGSTEGAGLTLRQVTFGAGLEFRF